MDKLNIRDILRAQDVTRWQIVRAKKQSVAEHTFAVQAVLMRLVPLLVSTYSAPMRAGFEERLLCECIMGAFWHDIPEVITGDIASPVKRLIRDGGDITPLDDLEKKVDPAFIKCYAEAKPLTLAIIKCADLMEMVYHLNEYGDQRPNTHSWRVQQGINNAFHEHVHNCGEDFPAFKWDVAHGLLIDMLDPSQETDIDSIVNGI
jgi:5'-deoxynucleotidase YfbR-like HD superfamily hydrolase